MIGCIPSYHVPSKKYGDQLLSTTKNVDGIVTNTFLRHGLTYVDQAEQKKLIKRNVFDEGRLIYKHPILKSNIGASKIFLRSGNNFVSKTTVDTIILINNDLPIMNRHFWGEGVVFSRLTDSSYTIKPTSDNSGTAKFYISTSHNYEEIKSDQGFIADSLVLSIR